MSPSRRIYLALSLFLMVIVVGTAGYMALLDASLLPALYMTVITVSSVGYSETVPIEGTVAQIFTMAIIMSGLASWTFFTLTLIAFLVESEFRKQFRLSRTMKRIHRMRGHYIICGLGQAGSSSLVEFLAVKAPCVVVEKDAEVVESILERHPEIPAIVGDATCDDTLLEAGIERAKGLIAATQSDSDNLLIVLTARSKNREVSITARATRTQNVDKLRIAGADNVIMPNVTGGMRMAATLLRPEAVNFLELMIRGSDDILRVEQATIPAGSTVIGKSLMDVGIPNKTGLLVLAIHHQSGDHTFNPTPTETFREADVLIVMGRREQMPKLKEILGIKR